MPHNPRLIEMVTVDQLDRNQEWTSAGFTAAVADIATTTDITLHGRSTDRWYRRHPAPFDTDRRLIWRSAAGGTPAPSIITSALDAALAS